MGVSRAAAPRGIPAMRGAAFEVKKTQVEFRSEGVACRGWFYEPADTSPAGCVVMAHGFGASPDGPLSQTARRFAAAGFTALAFDYRHFGASDGMPRQVINNARQLDDWAAAVAHVRERDDVDPAVVGLWGSSFSGGQVLAVAARDPKLAAVVAQVPYADGRSLARAAGIRHHIRLLGPVVQDLLRSATGRPPYLVEGLGPAGQVVRIDADLYETLAERAPSWPNRIAARSLLQIYGFRPIRLARKIRCPMLVVLTYQDGVAPPNIAIRAAEELPYMELAMFQADHFDLYSGPTYERAIHAEIRFFSHHFARVRCEVESDT